jgi:Phospholipase A2-like domain
MRYNRSLRSIKGKGILNSVINSLPLEFHVPGYQFCGPGTNLEKRLSRGDIGINGLDEACREHDIAYASFPDDLEQRHLADSRLEDASWERFKSSDAPFGEKVAAWGVTTAIKAKRKLGMGCRRKGAARRRKASHRNRRVGAGMRKGKGLTRGGRARRISFAMIKRRATSAINRKNDSVAVAVRKALRAVSQYRGKRNLFANPGRIIPVPKTGGAIPIVPILAGLSALGNLAGGASTIVDAVRNIMNARRQLFPSSAGTAVGRGLYLRPYKKGYGLYSASTASKN